MNMQGDERLGAGRHLGDALDERRRGLAEEPGQDIDIRGCRSS